MEGSSPHGAIGSRCITPEVSLLDLLRCPLNIVANTGRVCLVWPASRGALSMMSWPRGAAIVALSAAGGCGPGAQEPPLRSVPMLPGSPSWSSVSGHRLRLV